MASTLGFCERVSGPVALHRAALCMPNAGALLNRLCTRKVLVSEFSVQPGLLHQNAGVVDSRSW
jgi:hypothetical protein